jgi:hypothetical protein
MIEVTHETLPNPRKLPGMDRHYQLTDINFEYEGAGADRHAVALVVSQTFDNKGGPPVEVITVKIPFRIFDQLAISVKEARETD